MVKKYNNNYIIILKKFKIKKNKKNIYTDHRLL